MRLTTDFKVCAFSIAVAATSLGLGAADQGEATPNPCAVAAAETRSVGARGSISILHSYWHPNFTIEKRRLDPNAYREFATMQLCKSRDLLRDKLGVAPDLLAWPFGIHDKELASIARGCGYKAGVTLEGRLVKGTDPLMALPRFLVTDTAVGRGFAAMLPQFGFAAPNPNPPH